MLITLLVGFSAGFLGEMKLLKKQNRKINLFFSPVSSQLRFTLCSWLYKEPKMIYIFECWTFSFWKKIFVCFFRSGLLDLPLVSRNGAWVLWEWRDRKNSQWKICVCKSWSRGKAWCGQSIHDLHSGISNEIYFNLLLRSCSRKHLYVYHRYVLVLAAVSDFWWTARYTSSKSHLSCICLQTRTDFNITSRFTQSLITYNPYCG